MPIFLFLFWVVWRKNRRFLIKKVAFPSCKSAPHKILENVGTKGMRAPRKPHHGPWPSQRCEKTESEKRVIQRKQLLICPIFYAF